MLLIATKRERRFRGECIMAKKYLVKMYKEKKEKKLGLSSIMKEAGWREVIKISDLKKDIKEFEKNLIEQPTGFMVLENYWEQFKKNILGDE